MPRPTCFTSSSIGPCPTLSNNFLDREQTVSITWDDGFRFDDESWFRVFHQCEPPEVLDVADKLIANKDFYDLILAWDENVLRECKNAVFLTESACSWMDRKAGGSPAPFLHSFEGYGKALLSPVVENYVGCDVDKKKFSVSFLTSSKNMFPGHVLRQEIYERLPESIGDLQVMKHRSPPRIDDKRTVLEPYMFSIVPENSRHAGYYTEKVIDCFVAKTFPLYWGCPNLQEHFNPEGYMVFSDYDELLSQLSGLTPSFYQSRRQAMEDNHKLALQGVRQWDMIESYITAGIQRKLEERTEHSPAKPPQRTVFTSRRERPLRRPCTDL